MTDLVPTHDWQPLGQDKDGSYTYYRKVEVYQMKWTVDIGECMVAAAPYGGPIAVARDPKKLVKATSTQKPMIRTYTSSGVLISQFPQRDAIIHSMSWTSEELLVILFTHGLVCIYDMHGEKQLEDSLGAQSNVLQASYYPDGVVVLLEENTLRHITFEDRKLSVIVFPDLGCTTAPYTIQCRPLGEFQDSSMLQVYMSPHENDSAKGTLFMLNKLEKVDLNTPFQHVLKVAINPKGNLVATFNSNGKVNVSTANMQKNISEFNTRSREPPNQLLWCGNDVVVCCFLPEQIQTDKPNNTKSLVLIIGPGTDHDKYTYEGPVHAVCEGDCMRIVSNMRCDIVERVPVSTTQIFGLGSLEPSASLMDAYRDYEMENASSVNSLRELKAEQLTDAVTGCIDAAGHEWDTNVQTKLLKAAAYGKCFCRGYESDAFVDRCKALRVLNAVRDPAVGIPLTLTQYEDLSHIVLIDRLISRRLHFLAYRVSTYLDCKTEKVLVHWACSKVQAIARMKTNNKVADDELVRAIQEKFQLCPGISYRDVAETAFRLNKKNLAIQLLEKEPKVSDQVTLLIGMGLSEMALVKALDSGDTDQVYYVLLTMKKGQTDDELIATLHNNPAARDLFLTYCEHQDKKLLKKYYVTMQLHHQIAFHALRAYFNETDFANKLRLLAEARDNFSKRNDRKQEVDMMNEQDKLLAKQNVYAQNKKDPRFNQGFSVAATLRLLIFHKDFKEADSLAKELNVPLKMYHWIKLKALCKYQLWAELESFGKARKNPIGFAPFVEECIKAGQSFEAKKYVHKVEDYAARCEAYCDLSMFEDAIKTAEHEGDTGVLEAIRTRTTDAQHRQLIETAIRKIG